MREEQHQCDISNFDILTSFEDYADSLDALITIQTVFTILEHQGEFNCETDRINFGSIPYLIDEFREYIREKHTKKTEAIYKELESLKNEENV